jgi:23S rRNA (uridine2552-2'-O)-methyltransferase
MTRGRRATGPEGRDLTVRVRSAKGRKASSTRWLARHLNDPYVAGAKRRGYRSRAAWKLVQLDDKVHLLRRGARVVDLGAAPGGWTQVAVERTGAAKEAGAANGAVVALDIAPMEPVAGAQTLTMDIFADKAPACIAAALGGAAELVLSDMAASATGHRGTDRLRSVALCEAAAALAAELLAPGGALVIKVLGGGADRDLLAQLKRRFARVKHIKPPASRDESSETYLVATGFRGPVPDDEKTP